MRKCTSSSGHMARYKLCPIDGDVKLGAFDRKYPVRGDKLNIIMQ